MIFKIISNFLGVNFFLTHSVYKTLSNFAGGEPLPGVFNNKRDKSFTEQWFLLYVTFLRSSDLEAADSKELCK